MLTGIGRSGVSPLFASKDDRRFYGVRGLSQLTRRVGSKCLRHRGSRGLGALSSIPATLSESHIYNYSANIDCRSIPQYSAVPHRENFSATL